LPQGARSALIGGVIVAVYISMYPVALGGGQTEPLAAAAIVAAFAIATRAGASARTAAACGALTGSAALISLLALPAALAIGIVVAGGRAPTAGWRQGGIRRLEAFTFGALAVIAASVLVAMATGVLDDAWSAVVTYNRAYAALNEWGMQRVVTISTVGGLLLAPLLVTCAIGLLRWMRTRNLATSAVAATVWVVASWLAITATGLFLPHYLVIIIPPLVLLAVPAARAVLADPPSHRLVLGLLVGVAVGVAASTALFFWSGAGRYTNQPQVTAVADWIRSRASDSTGLFVWGNEPELYYAAGRTPATPYVYVLPLVTPGYAGVDLSQRVALDLAADLPQFVVDAGSERPGEPGIVPLLVPRPVLGDGRTLDAIDAIREVVRTHYGPPVEVAGWLIYERLPATRAP
jgi:hypothetical protein